MKIAGIMCTQDVPDRPPKCQSWQQEDLWQSCQSLFFFYIKWRGVKPNRTQNGCCKNVCRWELCGTVQSLKEKRGRSGWWKERGRAASQRISHSRPGLSAGGCARGEITGLLPRRSLHRHTATDRKLLAPGRLADSPRLCHLLSKPCSTDGASPTRRPARFLCLRPQSAWSWCPT